MLFSTPTFLFCFLPVVLTGYFLLPGTRARNGLLLVASLFFYAWGEGFYLVLLLVSIGANYAFGLWLGRLGRGGHGRAVLFLAAAANLLLLAAFKYVPGPVEAAAALPGLGAALAWVRPVHLPIGLSFFTFQALSYVIDVHRGRAEAQRNPLTLALYIALFPQLILGPIVRYRDIRRQLERRTVTRELLAEGVSRFIVGLGKKVLVADTLAATADRVFGLPHGELTFATAWLGVIAFTLQIYYDFSGYADMAIGLGRMFGLRFRENFRYPFIAQSRAELFQRWHISFFTWLRDYVYRPLCGRNCPVWRQNANILVVFFLAGLWHGASWTFIGWGLLNGAFIVVERLGLEAWLRRWWRPLRHAYVLSVTAASYAFFRADSLPQALALLAAMAGLAPAGQARQLALFVDNQVVLALVAGVVGATPAVPFLRGQLERLREAAPARPALALAGVQHAAGLAALLCVLGASALAIAAATHTPFIYFRF